MATESLVPDRSLINPKFEGYKLPPDEVDVKTTNLVSDVKVVCPRDDLFSLQYIRAFGSFNHLVVDRWQTNCERVFFVDENNEVQQATIKDDTVDTLESVFKIPQSEDSKEKLNSSIFFPSKDFACIGDGLGKLYIVNTEGRAKGSSSEWKVALVYEFDIPFVIVHATQDEKSQSLNCLLMSIIENDNEVSARKAHTIKLILGVFSQVKTSGSTSFSCEVIKHAQGHSAPLYAAIEPGHNAIIFASERPFHMIKEFCFMFASSFDGYWVLWKPFLRGFQTVTSIIEFVNQRPTRK